MNCIDTKKNIEALLDDELDDASKDAVEHHLWVCSDCRDMRERMSSLSSLLQVSRIESPSVEIDKRVMKSFQKHHSSIPFRWRRAFIGGFIVPKPAFAVLLILALAGFWLAFEIGKISSTTVLTATPSVTTNSIQTPAAAAAVTETKIETVVVEVPVVKEKVVLRTVYVREPKNNKNEKNNPSADAKQSNLPLYSSTVAENGYFTDVSLKGFQPSAEISARIIKEVREDEK
jgi:anti-sigma factor RsiW